MEGVFFFSIVGLEKAEREEGKEGRGRGGEKEMRF